MRFFYLFFLSLMGFGSVHGQSCSILISYDDNGNRVLREMACPIPRPASEGLGDGPVADAKGLLSQNVHQGGFSVFPNPTSDEVFVQLDVLSLQQSCTLVLLDVLGREHFRRADVGARTTIPLVQLPDGIYHVVLWRGQQKDAVKIVKEGQGTIR